MSDKAREIIELDNVNRRYILGDYTIQLVELFQFRNGKMNWVRLSFLEGLKDFGTHQPVFLPGFLVGQEFLEVKVFGVVLVPNPPATSKIRNSRLSTRACSSKDHNPPCADNEFRNGFD